jgi:hypothetical protein
MHSLREQHLRATKPTYQTNPQHHDHQPPKKRNLNGGKEAITLMGKSSATVTNLYNMCCEVCSSVVRSHPQMIGTNDDPIQIDKYRFVDKRKYN